MSHTWKLTNVLVQAHITKKDGSTEEVAVMHNMGTLLTAPAGESIDGLRLTPVWTATAEEDTEGIDSKGIKVHVKKGTIMQNYDVPTFVECEKPDYLAKDEKE